MATFNLTAGLNEEVVLNAGEDDVLIIPSGEVSNDEALNFQTPDRIDLTAFPDIDIDQVIADAQPLAGGAVRLVGPFGQLTLVGITINQLSADNFIVNEPPEAVDDEATVAEGGNVNIAVLENDTDADGDPLTITDVTDPDGGTAIVDGDEITYTPDDGFTGEDTFVYTISDGNGGTDTATVTVDVIPNTPPEAGDDTASINAGETANIAVLANDTDADGDPLTITGVTDPSDGTVVVDGDDITYTPDDGFVGTDSFTYTIDDGRGGTDTATVDVVVTNTAPDALDDSATVEPASTGTIAVLANDTDADGDPLTITGVTDPTNGTAIVDGDNITYTPDAGFSGDTDTFTYTISDGNGGTDTATVTVTVEPNTPPEAGDDTVSTPSNQIATIEVLTNDMDADGDPLTITGVTDPLNGTAIVDGDIITYSADDGFVGTDTFTYTIDDGRGGTDTATVTVDVGIINLAPELTADEETINRDTTATVAVLANDTDPDGDPLTIVGVTDPNNGTAVVDGDNVIYTPDAGVAGITDGFTYSVTDGNFTVTESVTVTVVDNTPPVAGDDALTIAEQTTATIAVLANDSDPDNDALEILGVSTPLNGSVTISGDDVVYTPGTTPSGNPFSGVDTFSYTIIDGNGGTDTAEVVVTVGGPLGPDANDDTAAIAQGNTATIAVLANDSDPDGDPLTVSGVADPANGTATIVGDDIIYTPDDPTFTGEDTFTYTVTDSGGLTDTATVTVNIEEQLPPVANDDDLTVPADQGVQTLAVLANDSDPNNDSLTVTEIGQPDPALGTVAISGGEVLFTPQDGLDPDVAVTTSFTYSITDGQATDSATVNLTIGGNIPPVAIDDVADIESGETATISVLANDTDANGDPLTIDGVSDPANGTATISGNQIVYTPDDPTFSGTDTFTYSISDGQGGSDTATVTVTVGVNAPPNAENDDVTAAANGTATIDVLANDSDPEGDPLTIVGVGSPSNGSAALDGSNVVYTPNTGFQGADSFTYSITDGNGGTSTATVNVTVDVNEDPVANPDATSIEAATTATIDVLGNDNDPDGDPLTIVGVSDPENGMILSFGGNDVVYMPNVPALPGVDATFVGVDTFTYTVTDSQGGTATAEVEVTVGGNLPVVPADDTATITEGTTATLNVLANDSDLDGDALVLVGTTQPTSGSVSVFANQVIYTPSDPTFTGVETFIYTVTDAQGSTDTATVTVTVEANQPPDAVDDDLTVFFNSTSTVDVLANDSDPNPADNLTITGVSGATNGTVTLSGNDVLYTPTDPTFIGTDSFTYTITDGNGAIDSATVSLTVSDNQPPVANDDSTTIEPGAIGTIAVIANDTDPNGDALIIDGLGTATNGALAISGTNIIYTPTNPTFTGTDSFIYTISDNRGGSDSATVSITVQDNQAPDAVDDNFTVESFPNTVTLAILDNDSDPEGGALTLDGISTPFNGTATISGTQVIYTPVAVDPNGDPFAGTDIITYTISDSQGLTDVATVTLTVGGNQPVEAVNDSASVIQQGTITIPVLANDTDLDFPDDTIQSITVSTPASGTATIFTNGTTDPGDDQIIYQPNSTFSGTDSFTYTITSGGTNPTTTDSATVTVTVVGNSAPDAVDDSTTIPLAALSASSTIPVLGNDTDPDLTVGDAISVVAAGGNNTAFGTVSVSGGQVIYTPNSGLADPFVGADSFTYTIQDLNGATDTATVTLTLGGNQPPIAVNDQDTITQGTTTTIAVLDNDTDIDGGTLSITGVSTPTNGTVTFVGDNAVYTPTNATFTGTDSFIYSITDGQGATASATVSISIQANQAPVATDDGFTVPVTAVANTLTVLDNDSDPEGDPLAITGVTGVNPTIGSVAIVSGNSELTYTPNGSLDPTFFGSDTFTYSITDGELTDTATVTVVVGGNQPPVAGDDATTVNQLTTTTIAVLSNDSDPEMNPLSIVGTPVATDGTVSVVGDELVYVSPTFAATDTFAYTITDGLGGSDSATVTVTVLDNQAVVANNDFIAPVVGEMLTVPVTLNDSDPDGDPLTLVGISAPTNGTAVTAAGNDVIYDATGVAAGTTDSFTYTVTDGTDTATATVFLEVFATPGTTRQIFGTTGDDLLVGSNDASILEELDGGDGNDVLIGGLASDLLIGGAGADNFLFQSENDSRTPAQVDRLSDFNPGEMDIITLNFAIAAPSDIQVSFSGGLGRIDISGTSFSLELIDTDGNIADANDITAALRDLNGDPISGVTIV